MRPARRASATVPSEGAWTVAATTRGSARSAATSRCSAATVSGESAPPARGRRYHHLLRRERPGTDPRLEQAQTGRRLRSGRRAAVVAGCQVQMQRGIASATMIASAVLKNATGWRMIACARRVQAPPSA